MNDIDFDKAEQNICCNCVDDLWGQGKSEKLNKMGDSTLYGKEKEEDDKEEVEGKVIGGGSDGVSVMPVVYPCGTVGVSSLGSFSSIGSSSKTSHH